MTRGPTGLRGRRHRCCRRRCHRVGAARRACCHRRQGRSCTSATNSRRGCCYQLAGGFQAFSSRCCCNIPRRSGRRCCTQGTSYVPTVCGAVMGSRRHCHHRDLSVLCLALKVSDGAVARGSLGCCDEASPGAPVLRSSTIRGRRNTDGASSGRSGHQCCNVTSPDAGAIG